MPMSPPRSCAGCRRPFFGSAARCPECAEKARTTREARRERDYNHGGVRGVTNWKELRAAVLARDPLCTLCGRKPSTTAEHRIPRRDGGGDTMENLQGACHSCSSRKTAARDGGFGNPKRRTV